jgi:hypothetical protein
MHHHQNNNQYSNNQPPQQQQNHHNQAQHPPPMMMPLFPPFGFPPFPPPFAIPPQFQAQQPPSTSATNIPPPFLSGPPPPTHLPLPTGIIQHSPAAPDDQEQKKVIDKLANFVARNGSEFESVTKEKQQNNPLFKFLYGGEYHQYYQYKLNLERELSITF